MTVDQFLRTFNLRSAQTMWFLGAGASASAGIPTAWHMIWDFKRQLYCTAQRVSLSLCQDLSDDRVRERLQIYFDGKSGFPVEDSENEYAYYFEEVYPLPDDRRRYIDQLVSKGTPSFGHRTLAAFLELGKARVVWTTNFDRMIEDAFAELTKTTGSLTVTSLDNAHVALDALNDSRWPLLAKIHGDFQSSRLKNISSELQSQDVELRHALIEACKRYGMVVMGYSGRDNSIMDALEEVLENPKPFPHGLFWFTRSGSPVFSRVSNLIDLAQSKGVDANIIEIETFDELMSDLLLLENNLPDHITKYLDHQPKRVTNAPIPDVKGKWPLIRFNALHISDWPATCRRVKCKIGGQSEVREAVQSSGTNIIAYRRNLGVMAFGQDTEVRKAFETYDVSEFDLHTIADNRLNYDSMELALLYEALIRAIERECPVLTGYRKGTYVIITDASRTNLTVYEKLKKATGTVTGTIPGTKARWAEAIQLRLERRLGRIWLLFEPTIWVDYSDEGTKQTGVKDFIRERLARRYNNKWNSVIEGWIAVLLDNAETRQIRTFGIGDGVDASFTLTSKTAFSWQAKD